jgi:CRISPR/Cas system-associated protein Cas5 (RAMP superfamily)
MMKARLRKIEGLTHNEIKQNISNVVRNIPKEKYKNIFKGAYNRNAVYVKNKTRKNNTKKYLK